MTANPASTRDTSRRVVAEIVLSLDPGVLELVHAVSCSQAFSALAWCRRFRQAVRP